MDYKIEKERIYSNIEYAFNDMQIIKEKLGYYLEEEKQKWYCDLEDDERIYINNIAEKLEAYYKIAILENVENENNPKIIDIYIY